MSHFGTWSIKLFDAGGGNRIMKEMAAWSRLGPNRRRNLLTHLLNDSRGLATDGVHEATAVFAKFGFVQSGIPNAVLL